MKNVNCTMLEVICPLWILLFISLSFTPRATTAFSTAHVITYHKGLSVAFAGGGKCLVDSSSLSKQIRTVGSLRNQISGVHCRTTVLALAKSPADGKNDNSNDDTINGEVKHKNDINKLDEILGQLTNMFPLFVTSAAILGMARPQSLQWVNQGNLITYMLSTVMWGTGLTLTKEDFTNILNGDDRIAIPLGVLCQYLIMPTAAYVVGRTLLLSSSTLPKSLFLGLILVGCSPGGTASNLVTLIAQANVALSVLLTSVSTMMASICTPLLTKFLVGSTIAISGWTLCKATASVVLLPVILGMVVNQYAPTKARRISRFTPFASVLLVSLICGGVVAQNSSLLSGGTGGLLPRVILSVLSLHILGFTVGYLIPKHVFKREEETARTISIETGMQNSALAVVLARSISTAGPLACIPGALSATVHSCLGSMLAAYWRWKESQKNS